MIPDHHRWFGHIFIQKHTAKHGGLFKLDAIQHRTLLRFRHGCTRLIRNFLVFSVNDGQLERIGQHRIKREHALRVRYRFNILQFRKSITDNRFTSHANHSGNSTGSIGTSHDATKRDRIPRIRDGTCNVAIFTRASKHANTKCR